MQADNQGPHYHLNMKESMKKQALNEHIRVYIRLQALNKCTRAYAHRRTYIKGTRQEKILISNCTLSTEQWGDSP